MKEEQIQYNRFVETVSAELQERLNGGKGISRTEEYFIQKYAKTSVLDIGCGTANRTFQTYTDLNLRTTGIEKSDSLINASTYKDQIIKLDVGDPLFLNHTCFNIHFDLAVCLRGVINGFIDEEFREQAWKNLVGLLSTSCVDYLLVDTFTNVSWYETGETGQCVVLNTVAPPQYMYSRKELLELFKVHNLELVEETKENFGMHLTIAYFLLKLKK